MEKQLLAACLAKRMSLASIGKLLGKHPSTISYWLKKHELSPCGKARHAPKGEFDQVRLRELVARGFSIRHIADELGAGYSTIRYWLARLDLETDRSIRRREAESARRKGLQVAQLTCPVHGRTAFLARLEGGYRCATCSSKAVSERRRHIKRLLVSEAGGGCTMCGFTEHPAALQFHHVDPATKEFHLGCKGITRSIDRMRFEARKCVLLCANCHAMVEAGVKKAPPIDR